MTPGDIPNKTGSLQVLKFHLQKSPSASSNILSSRVSTSCSSTSGLQNGMLFRRGKLQAKSPGRTSCRSIPSLPYALCAAKNVVKLSRHQIYTTRLTYANPSITGSEPQSARNCSCLPQRSASTTRLERYLRQPRLPFGTCSTI